MLGIYAGLNQIKRPQTSNVDGLEFRPQPRAQLRSPIPNPFGGDSHVQNQPLPPGPRSIANVQNMDQPKLVAQNINLPPEKDQEFFNSLPEDWKQELLRNYEMQRRNLDQPPLSTNSQANIANAEQMDTASFLAILTDENLRREILIGMDEQTLSTLPPHIHSEARRYQREILRQQYRIE